MQTRNHLILWNWVCFYRYVAIIAFGQWDSYNIIIQIDDLPKTNCNPDKSGRRHAGHPAAFATELHIDSLTANAWQDDKGHPSAAHGEKLIRPLSLQFLTFQRFDRKYQGLSSWGWLKIYHLFYTHIHISIQIDRYRDIYFCDFPLFLMHFLHIFWRNLLFLTMNTIDINYNNK